MQHTLAHNTRDLSTFLSEHHQYLCRQSSASDMIGLMLVERRPFMLHSADGDQVTLELADGTKFGPAFPWEVMEQYHAATSYGGALCVAG